MEVSGVNGRSCGFVVVDTAGSLPAYFGNVFPSAFLFASACSRLVANGGICGCGVPREPLADCALDSDDEDDGNVSGGTTLTRRNSGGFVVGGGGCFSESESESESECSGYRALGGVGDHAREGVLRLFLSGKGRVVGLIEPDFSRLPFSPFLHRNICISFINGVNVASVLMSESISFFTPDLYVNDVCDTGINRLFNVVELNDSIHPINV